MATMTTNKAPEKLYLDTTENPDNVWLRAFRPPFNTCGIEYIRTDIFIEKADKFISSFFHPDDTELIDAVLNRFHVHIDGINDDYDNVDDIVKWIEYT